MLQAKDDQEKAELDEARRVQVEKDQELRDVKKQRTDLFMAAFTHVADVIDPIYKELTKANVSFQHSSA